jgi:hypothetical protein
MTKVGEVRWGRWVGLLAGLLVFLKSVSFLVSRLIGLAKNEVQARGGDVTFVLGLAERRRTGHGHGAS